MATLETDLASELFREGVEQGFWSSPDRESNRVFITIFAADGKSFLARLDCSSYGDQPIRCEFVNPKTRQVDMAYWPQGNDVFVRWVKFNHNPPFICSPQDRGGIDVGNHSEWRTLKQWHKTPNQIVSYLDFLRQLLHVESLGYLRQK